jgi:hypothetical protein
VSGISSTLRQWFLSDSSAGKLLDLSQVRVRLERLDMARCRGVKARVCLARRVTVRHGLYELRITVRHGL